MVQSNTEKNAQRDAEKAETWQSIKALLIPLTLFLACIASAAGTFLVYNQEPLGWVFLVGAGIVIVLDIIGLIRFQNKWRAKGMVVSKEDEQT